MKIASIGVKPALNPIFKAKNRAVKNADFTDEQIQKSNHKSKFKKILPFALMTTGIIGGIGLGYAIGKNKIPFLNKIKLKLNKTQNNIDKAWMAILALAGITGYEAGKISNKDKDEIIDILSKQDSHLQRRTNDNSSQLSEIESHQTNPLIYKHTKEFSGLTLLTQNNLFNRNSEKYENAIKYIQEIGTKKLTDKPQKKVIDKQNPTIWSVTSEFAPVKEGGLGSVPPEIRNNFTKLGVKTPTFIPMYLNDGLSNFVKLEDDKYIYRYKGREFNLEKIATVKTDTYRNSQSKVIPLEYYLYTENKGTDDEKQLIFIKTDGYFDGTIYEQNSKTEENEKFALMSKAVYEFLKLKTEGLSSVKEVEINSKQAFDSIEKPDGMILNDWQACPIAALINYKAPLENAHSALSDKTLEYFKNLPLITIGHNCMYQGSSQNDNDYKQKSASTTNILNTLFDRYTYDVVSNAKLSASETDPDDLGLKDLDNVLVLKPDEKGESYINLLNIGVILSDYFHPVSQNYADELVSKDHGDLSYTLQWALIQKAKAGKLVGIINGNDYNNLSIEKKKDQIKNLTGVDFKTYSKDSNMEDIVLARYSNKVDFYNKFILPFSESQYSTKDEIDKVKKLSTRLEFYKGIQGTQLPKYSEEDFEAPILTSGGRLVSQKGVDILCDAIKMLFENWDKDFPSKPKPIFYIAGQDGEGGVQRSIIEKLKNEDLSKEDSDRVLFAHGFAPLSAMMAASDFFLMPSKFEPCGLTQGESLALGTPVIASAVGGIVDTINRNGKRNGILTDKEKPLNAEEFYKAIKKGLEIYFVPKRKEYNSMIMDSINEDYSWVQKNKQGPAYDYLEALGKSRQSLPEIN